MNAPALFGIARAVDAVRRRVVHQPGRIPCHRYHPRRPQPVSVDHVHPAAELVGAVELVALRIVAQERRLGPDDYRADDGVACAVYHRDVVPLLVQQPDLVIHGVAHQGGSPARNGRDNRVAHAVDDRHGAVVAGAVDPIVVPVVVEQERTIKVEGRHPSVRRAVENIQAVCRVARDVEAIVRRAVGKPGRVLRDRDRVYQLVRDRVEHTDLAQ